MSSTEHTVPMLLISVSNQRSIHRRAEADDRRRYLTNRSILIEAWHGNHYKTLEEIFNRFEHRSDDAREDHSFAVAAVQTPLWKWEPIIVNTV